MGRKSSYKPKYCKQLIGTDKEPGLRYEGLSVIEVCQIWRITKATYYTWVKEHEKFAEAHEWGKVDVAAYWQRQARKAANGEIKANAGVMQFTLKNVDPDNWQDRIQIADKGPEKIHTINVNILEHKSSEFENSEQKVLEHSQFANSEQKGDIEDAEFNE